MKVSVVNLDSRLRGKDEFADQALFFYISSAIYSVIPATAKQRAGIQQGP
jgi:hypothetical protein